MTKSAPTSHQPTKQAPQNLPISRGHSAKGLTSQEPSTGARSAKEQFEKKQSVTQLCDKILSGRALSSEGSLQEASGQDCRREKASSDENGALTENEKFELLSVYMDGEASSEEQQQVERWLVSDAGVRQQYNAQLKLSQALKSLLS